MDNLLKHRLKMVGKLARRKVSENRLQRAMRAYERIAKDNAPEEPKRTAAAPR